MKTTLLIIGTLLSLSIPANAAEEQYESQLDMNLRAAAEADKAREQVQKELKTLGAKYSQVANLKSKLDESYLLWNNFKEAQVNSIFPLAKGEDYRSQYGSIYGLCVGNIERDLANARLAELKTWTKPPAKKDLEASKAEFDAADKTLNDTYAKVMRYARSKKLFKQCMIKAETAWIAQRDVDANIYELITGVPEANLQKKTDLTKARNKQLNQWVVGIAEGDGCGGSYPLKK